MYRLILQKQRFKIPESFSYYVCGRLLRPSKILIKAIYLLPRQGIGISQKQESEH